jgi:hypothetical protein
VGSPVIEAETMSKRISFAFAVLGVLAAGSSVATAEGRDAVAPLAAAATSARVTFRAVDRATGAPHNNSSYGSIYFFATGEDGAIYEPDEGGTYVFTEPGHYQLGGQSVYNFCYSDSADVFVDEHTVSIDVRLFISCE